MRLPSFVDIVLMTSLLPLVALAETPSDVSVLGVQFSADFDTATVNLSKAAPQDSIRYDVLINGRMVAGGSLGSTNSAVAVIHGYRQYFLELGAIDFNVVFQACPQDETTALDYLKYCGPKSQPIPVHFVTGDRFQDVPANYPYTIAIDYAQANGIVAGYPDNTFHPEALINRAEFTKIIMRATVTDVDFSSCEIGTYFPDVPNRTWFAYYVCVAQQRGIVVGYPDGNFHPEYNINFAEAAKILASTFHLSITADSRIWYKGFVDALRGKNAIPVSITHADQDITRGEMAELIYRLKIGSTSSSSFSSQSSRSIHSSSSSESFMLCAQSECGPQLGLSNWKCADGSGTGGPTGRCISTDNHQSCHWEIHMCPQP